MSENEPLQVCIVSKQFPPGVGGGETYAHELANGLAERGHDVDVYTQWIDDPNPDVDVHENVTVTRIAKARRKLVTFETLWFSVQARRKIDFSQYDIVHGTLMPPSTAAVTLFNDIDAPVVVTSHGTSLGETKAVALEEPADYLLKFFFYPLNVVFDFIAGQQADQVIAISDHAYEELTDVYRFDEENVEMIPHGVDTDWFYPREETHSAVDPEKTTLLYVGRLGARKGLGLALRAFARVDADDVEFLIAGTGRHEERLRELASDLRIRDQVRFLGYVEDDDLPMLYSSVDVFVLASRYEGFGLVLLEAMGCKTPVIGVDAGGIPTAIKEGTGKVADRNVQALTTAIQSLVDGTHTEMAEHALAHACDSSWATVVDSVEAVYTKPRS